MPLWQLQHVKCKCWAYQRSSSVEQFCEIAKLATYNPLRMWIYFSLTQDNFWQWNDRI